jgi:hypothetical protein
VATQKLECRGACFSSNGNNIFSIQCSRRGASHLVRWAINLTPYELELQSQDESVSDSPGKESSSEILTKLNIVPEMYFFFKIKSYDLISYNLIYRLLLLLNVYVKRVIEINKGPSTRLCSTQIYNLTNNQTANDKNSYLAIGGSDGSVTVIRQTNLKKILFTTCHEFPVTGMGFCPDKIDSKGKN